MRFRLSFRVIDHNGVPLSGASVTVRDRDTDAASTVFQQNVGSETYANPVTTDAQGRVAGWVDDGAYEALVSHPSATSYLMSFDALPGTNGQIIDLFIIDGAVTTAKIVDSAITSAKIPTDNVLPVHIPSSAIGTTEILDGAVTTIKILDAAVTKAKMATGITGNGQFFFPMAFDPRWKLTGVVHPASVQNFSATRQATSSYDTFTGGSYAWNDPGFPAVGSYASSLAVSTYLYLVGFGFTVPAGATVTNAKVNYIGSSSDGTGFMNLYMFTSAGGAATSVASFTPAVSTPTPYTFDPSYIPPQANVNQSWFGIRAQVSGGASVFLSCGPLSIQLDWSISTQPTRTTYQRAYGEGTITGIGFHVVTSAGNVSVGVYTNTGTGTAARPGPMVRGGVAVACPAAGFATVTFAAQAVTDGNYWFALSINNGTTSIYGNDNTTLFSSILANGFSHYEDIHPCPGVPAASLPTSNKAYALVGV